jgi:hypothetical protein
LPENWCVPHSLVAASGQTSTTNLNMRLANSLSRVQWGTVSDLFERNNWTQYMHVERGRCSGMQQVGVTIFVDEELNVRRDENL